MRGDGGEPYDGSSWSRACGSSKELRNLGGGDSEPSTELNNDIVASLQQYSRRLKVRTRQLRGVVVCVQVSAFNRGYLMHVNKSPDNSRPIIMQQAS
jgi:hypothetical protein